MMQDVFRRSISSLIEMVRPRSVGALQAALSAMRACGFEGKLAELGLNRPQIAAAVGHIVGRMAHPGSELATHAWLQKHSALGELIDFDFESMDLNRTTGRQTRSTNTAMPCRIICSALPGRCVVLLKPSSCTT